MNPVDRASDTRQRCHERGFTLIEVLIVVAIIGILAAVAYPSYSEQVRQTRRSDAQLALLEAAQTMERCRSTSYTYVGCTLSRATSPEGHYTLALNPAATRGAFTIVATATGAQAGDSACPTLTIDQTGDQGHTGDGPCWE